MEILYGLLVLLFIYLLFKYNFFIKLNNKVKEAFSTMDVYFKKRWDLIPNIVETVKGYATHEKTTFEKIVELRNSTYDDMNLNAKLDVNEKLSSDLYKLMALAEAYPELKANDNFLNLSRQLVVIEDEIANSRKYYNAMVRIWNNYMQTFPSNIVAKLFGYKSLKMFEISEEERKNIQVKL